MTVAFSLSLFGFILSLGKFLYGCITDRVGSYHSNFLFGLFVIIGQILCCFAYTRNNVILFSSMILRGLGLPLTTVGYSIWATDFSDTHSYGVVIQRIQLLHCLSSLVFMPFPGILTDITGSYTPSYICYALFSIISIAGIQGVYHYHRKKQK